MLNEVVTQRQLFAQLKVDEMAEVVSRPFHLSQLRHAGENNDNYPIIIQKPYSSNEMLYNKTQGKRPFSGNYKNNTVYSVL